MKSVLIVDDEPLMRGLITSQIKISRPGVYIDQAEDGWKALNKLISGTKFDLIISDVKMPNMDGITLAEKVREEHPNIFIILMSGNTEPENHKAHAFLKKPFERADLLTTIGSLMEKRK